MSRRFLPIAALVLCLAGCREASPPLALGPIAKVEIQVRVAPDAAGPAAPCTASLAAHDDLEEVGTWLEEMDWTQPGQDMSVIGLPQPDGTVVITGKDGGTNTIAFFWDGRVVHPRANRLLSGANMPRLRRLVAVAGACK